jgi:hypothetical protein
MKKICKTSLIAIILLAIVNGVPAQITQTKPDQQKSIKQFVGIWKCELGKDTFLITENNLFGTGMVSNSQIVANGKVIDSIRQLYGYDKKIDKFIIAELIESSPVIEICNAWFTSENSGEIIITNPENSPLKFKFEFKSPDIIIQTAILNGKVFKEITGNRTKYDLNQN